ncbi:class I SAM-dependent methyltransferase [Bacillus sp. OxB-1]|uniref:class I SAM-dependent methyltransferase n=1 Tax=Bacillus sp. (strain OxB-1) TaxID=98228 RepID=UPI000695B282|nr:class I SAM-dependent methyltransferase [Bacillus sp. OxB-1]
MSTIITTGGRPDEVSIELAMVASQALGYPFVERRKTSVAGLQQRYGSHVIVAGKGRFELFRIGMDKPFFFHPNTAVFRLKRLARGEKDPMVEAAGLQAGDSFLDCTLGLASDSIVASYITGETGQVTGVEADRDVAFLTERGLRTFPSDDDRLRKAMRRIDVLHSDARSFLQSQPADAWDVVYLDPMFHAPIEESANFTPLREVGVHGPLTDAWWNEALRVSRRCVVVKDRYDSVVFERFGMRRVKRPNTKFHFGYLNKI